MRILKWLVRIAAVGGLVSLAGALGEFHFLLEQIASFRVQYICGLLVALGAALVIRTFLPAAIILLVLSVHGYAVASMYIPGNTESEVDGFVIRVMSSNLLASNTNYDAQIESIYKIDPDLIVFQEYSRGWDAALSRELKRYPYRISEVRDSSFGIALYSKFELSSAEVITLGLSTLPIVDAVVNINSQQLRILGVHPPPPVSSRMFDLRNSQLIAISEAVTDEAGPLIVTGDLNTTPWSVHFEKLVGKARLHDVRRGFGIHPTWPSMYPLAQIPIDHILVNDVIRALDVGTEVSQGSDHNGLWADLELRNQQGRK